MVMTEWLHPWLESVSQRDDKAVLLFTLLAPVVFAVIIRSWTKAKQEEAVPFVWTAPRESRETWTGPVLDEPSLHAESNDTISSYDPATGQLITTFPSLTTAQMAEQVRLASKASVTWRTTSFAERRKVMRSLLHWIIENKEDIARTCVRDTGKTMLDAAFGELLTTCEKIRWMIAYGEHYLRPDARATSWLLAHKISHVHYEPLGVVAAIVSWNYPFHNLFSPVLAALMSGNAIVVKTSENVSWSSQAFASAIRSCLEACGHDPDVVQVAIGCEAEAAIALTRDPRISHITFIGSDAVGKEVAKNAAEALTPVTLELGGKDPAIILETADIGYFQDIFLRGVFTGAGQGCIASERFIVHQKVYQQFIDILSKRVADLQPGRDVGAMVNGTRLQHLEQLVQNAVKGGARLLVGGRQYQHPQRPQGHYFEPTLLVDVTQDMTIAQEECFAPILLVMKAQSTEECIAIANASKYGLGAAVFGRNKADCKYVAGRLQCGMVSCNDFGVFYLNQSLPFGGCKASGYQRFGGPEGLRALCNIKAVTYDRFHGLLQTTIPPPLRFPILHAQKSWTFVCGLIDLMYSPEWKGKLGGIWKLIASG